MKKIILLTLFSTSALFADEQIKLLCVDTLIFFD